ncbi:MAG: DUF2029 domain-containing protein [Planctomycetia bacterium]|nr:DUF2029 domain-containing protein [Planctomycetia bacterium]
MSNRSHIRRHWAVFLGLVVALAVWCAVDVSRRARVDPQRPGLHMTDVTVYTEAGAAFFDGREPYEVANIRGWKYLYPPLFALMMAPLAQLAPPAQAAVWFGISALMCFGIYFECRRILCHALRIKGVGVEPEGPSHIPGWIVACAAITAVLPAVNCLQRGQMGVALLYPLLLGFRLIVTSRAHLGRLLGGVILALPVALKLTPLLPVACVEFVIFLACWNHQSTKAGWALWSSAGCIAGAILFFLLIPASLVGWNKNLHYLAVWHEKVAVKVNDVRSDDFAENVDSPRNQSLANAAYRFGNWIAYEFAGGPYDALTGKDHGLMPMDAPPASNLLLGGRCLALVVLLLVAIRAGRSGDPLLWGVALGLSSVATLVVSPVARGHYFVLFLPASLFVPLWFLQRGRHRVAVRAAIIPAALVVAHYTLLDYTGRIGLLGIGTALWYFAVCVRIAFERKAVAAGNSETNTVVPMSRAA